MQKSLKVAYKFIEIYSDGCLQTNYLISDISKQSKKLIIHKKYDSNNNTYSTQRLCLH